MMLDTTLVSAKNGISKPGWAYLALTSLTLLSFWMYRANVNFYIFANGGSQLEISIFESAYFLPSLVITYFGGLLADKSRNLLSWLAAFSVVNLAILAFVAFITYTISFPFYTLVAATTLLGIIGSLRNPPAAIFVRMITSKTVIPRMNSLLSAGFNVARIAGPIAVGLLSFTLTTEQIFSVMPVLCLPLVLFFVFIRSRINNGADPHDTAEGRSFRGLSGFFGLIVKHRFFLGGIVAFFLASNLLWTTLPFVVADSFGRSQQIVSYSYAIFGAGAILGSIAQPTIYQRQGIRWCFIYGSLLYGFYYVVALVAAGWFLLVSIVVAGAGMGLFYSSINTHVLMLRDRSSHGRVLAISIMMTNGFLAIGSMILSYVAVEFSNATAFIISCMLLFVVAPAVSIRIRESN